MKLNTPDVSPTAAPAQVAQGPFLQILRLILLTAVALVLAISCTRRPPPPPPEKPMPAVPAIQTVTPTPRTISAGDPMLSKFKIEKQLEWILNEGPGHRFKPQSGEVSFYQKPQKMASGDHFDPEELTAAHLTLPLFSVVRCTRVDDGRTVEVLITDRGPNVEGRILDLSRAAARRLGMTKDGVVRCRVDVLAYPSTD